MKSCLITLSSPQSIVWAEFLCLPTELKLLTLNNQKTPFLWPRSVISSPETATTKMHMFWKGGRFKRYHRMLGKNLCIDILKYHVVISVKKVLVGWCGGSVVVLVG